jgi:hypothetical protein
MREEYGLATTTLKLNRHQRWLGSGCGGSSSSSTTTGVLMSRRSVGGGLMSYINRARILLLIHMDYGSSNFQAIIASGTGPDGLAEARESRKRRRFIV